MSEENQVVAIQPTRKMLPIFQRNADYPIVLAPDGSERLMIPVREYRRVRGDAGYWRTLFFLSFVAFCGFALVVLMKPPTLVEKPLIIEKQVPVVVQGRCYAFCSK